MNVLIADKFEKTGVEQLEAMGCKVIQNPDLSGDTLKEAVAETGCEVLVVRSTKVPADVLGAAKNLKLVIRAGSGYDTIDVSAATERNIRVCNCPGMNAVAVAELTIGMMVALDRRIVDNTVDLRKGVWNKKEYSKARGLKGRTLGIIGLGKIGCEVAQRAAAFEMNILYADIIDRKDMEKEYGLKKVGLDQILAESDFISVHVPGGEGTKHIIGEAELAKMKPTACILNCARGGTVDEKALARAVEAGKVGGAGLDVYEVEPLATAKDFADPVVQSPRVYGTHHIGASTDQAQSAVADETVRIIKNYKDSGQFINCVNMPA
jgi:D-3-phosphoglycerate dehydrogenase